MFGFGPEMIYEVPGLIIALTVHEYAHAAVAVACGDFTPRLQGRLTLNPITHIDPWGLIALFLFKFGWARPVMINPRNFRNMRRDDLLVSLAGPAANVIAAFAAGIVLALLFRFGLMQHWLQAVLWMVILLNVNFAVFNLLPIPPLDGSKILMNILPYDMARQYAQIERYGMVILIIFLLLANTQFLGSLLGLFTRPLLGLIQLVMTVLLQI